MTTVPSPPGQAGTGDLAPLCDAGAGVRLKVCGITQPAEVDVLAGAGVDFMGLWYAVPDGPRDLPLEAFAALAQRAAAGPDPHVVLVTFARDAGTLAPALEGSHVHFVQLHGYQTPGLVRALKRLAPDVRVIKVLHLRGGECVEAPLVPAYEKAGVDIFLLDVVAADGRVGSTGEQLDVTAALTLADTLSRPFLLAGGISDDNHARHDALAAHPLFLGVDVDTNARGGDGQIDGGRVAAISGAWKGDAGGLKTVASTFIEALLAARLPLIMEIKRHDGNEADLMRGRSTEEVLREYLAVGASCISVVTGRWFGGDDQMLRDVSALTDLPILKKDFITREKQIVAAQEMGASALLLTARILSKSTFQALIEKILEHGLTPFVEVADEAELQSVIHPRDCIIAINNKDIRTQERDAGELDVSRSLLAATIATGTPCPVSASAITEPRVAAELIDDGFKGLLIGTGLLRAESVKGWVEDFERYRGRHPAAAAGHPARETT